ncbi:hypothetical protein LTR85_011115 [Meristemomyces frigidus]|nr:hypothetical protein LTR85_011115 [Meristemomyces frigidus]
MHIDGISVFIVDESGKHQSVTHNLNLTKFRALCDLPVTGCNNPKLPKNSVILPQGTADQKAAARITTWIATSDLTKPKPLSPDVLKLEKFDDMVNVLATSHVFRIKRDIRGNELRDRIYEYIKQGPLSFDEFAMVCDYLHFDVGLVKTAMHAVMFNKAKGGARIPPDMAKIEAFCKQHDIWDEILAIEDDITYGMEKRNRQDEEKAEARRERRARTNFTTIR